MENHGNRRQMDYLHEGNHLLVDHRLDHMDLGHYHTFVADLVIANRENEMKLVPVFIQTNLL